MVTSATEEDRLAYLTDEELARAASFAREKRRQEWTASRIAVKLLALELGLCEDPRKCSVVSSYRKPAIAIQGSHGSMHVSISHSEGAGAAALDPRPIGIDIQKLRELKPRATKFFLKESEVRQMESVSLEDRLIHFWCAKEAAYKLRTGPGWLKRVSIELRDESAGSLAFSLSYPVSGTVDTFRMGDDYVGAVARQLKP